MERAKLTKKGRRHGEGRKEGRGIAYGAKACGRVDGEEGDLVDLGAEDGELGGGAEVEAAVAGGEPGGPGEEGAAAGEGEPEGEAVPALDPRVAARVVHPVGVPGGQRREGGERQGEQQRRGGGGHGGGEICGGRSGAKLPPT